MVWPTPMHVFSQGHIFEIWKINWNRPLTKTVFLFKANFVAFLEQWLQSDIDITSLEPELVPKLFMHFDSFLDFHFYLKYVEVINTEC